MSPLTLRSAREVLMPCTKAPGIIVSRDTAVSVLLAARLSDVPRSAQQESSSAGAQARRFGSGGHGGGRRAARGELSGAATASPFLGEPCVPQEKRKSVSSEELIP